MRIIAVVLAIVAATIGATVSGLAAPLLPPVRAWLAPPPTVDRSPPWREADAVAGLRAILGRRGYPDAVVRGPMAAWPPGGRELAEAGLVLDPETEELLAEPWPAEAWLVCTNAGCWWVWQYGTAAPADREAHTREALHRARVRLGGVDPD